MSLDSRRIGYASGVFDMFHVGHLRLLERAAAGCDVLVAGVATDAYAERVKGRRPVVPFDERCEIVAALTMVDAVVADDAEDKSVVWHRYPFDIFFKGDDWRGTAKGDLLEITMAGLDVEVCYLPYTQQTSSTLLRSALETRVEPAGSRLRRDDCA